MVLIYYIFSKNKLNKKIIIEKNIEKTDIENIEKDDLVYLILSTDKKLSKNKVGNIYIPIKKISLLKVLIKSWRL